MSIYIYTSYNNFITQVFTNNPAGTGSRFNKISLQEWDSATAANFVTDTCDSNHGESLPGAGPGSNLAAYAAAQTSGVTGGEWTRDSTTATRNFDSNGVSTSVQNLNRYVGHLSPDEIRGCSTEETEIYLAGNGGSIERKITFPVYVYGLESSGNEDSNGVWT